MDLSEAIKERHSVRTYNDRPLEPAVEAELRSLIDECNREAGTHIQLILNEPQAFRSFLSRIQHFHNVKNYIAMVGKEGDGMDEKIGYYGEQIVLRARQLSLGTCWVAMTYSKGKCVSQIDPGEKRYCVIAIGYSDQMGEPRPTKSIEELSEVHGEMPQWFRRGMEAAQLAPTGKNKQNFKISLEGDQVRPSAGKGLSADLDLGIVKYHFEIGAKDGSWKWAQ